MPAPKVASVDQFFERLDDVQRPHLDELRRICLEAADGTGVIEELKFNFPAYTMPVPGDARAKPIMVWTLQCFKGHCSVRFPVSFFSPRREPALAAGYDAIEGALKIRWDQEMPSDLVAGLLADRIADFESGNTAWSTPGQYAGKKK